MATTPEPPTNGACTATDARSSIWHGDGYREAYHSFDVSHIAPVVWRALAQIAAEQAAGSTTAAR